MKKKYIAINDLLDLSEELRTEEELAHELLMSGESAEFINGVCWGINHLANQAFLDPRCLRFDPHELSESEDKPLVIKAVCTKEELEELKEMLKNQLPSYIKMLGEDTDGILEKNISELSEKYKRPDEKITGLECRIITLGSNILSPYTGTGPSTDHLPFAYDTIITRKCSTQD